MKFAFSLLLTALSTLPALADGMTPPSSTVKPLLRVFRSGGWGVAAQDNKLMQILSDGKVECQYYDLKKEGRITYATLATIPQLMLEEIDRRSKQLGKKQLEGEVTCSDDTRQYYDLGDYGGIFLNVAIAPGCGTQRINEPASHYLEGIADAYYFACPESPAVKQESNP